MTRAVWLRADDAVGDWDARRRRVTAGLEAGVDRLLVDEDDVERVRELGEVAVAVFRAGGDGQVMDAEASSDDTEALVVVGKDGEGDGSVDLPATEAASGARAALASGEAAGVFVRILGEDYEAFAEGLAPAAEYTIVVGEDWSVIPLENLIARVGDETTLVAGVDSAAEARTAFETLEVGADAVLLDADDPDEIRATVAVRDDLEREHLDLEWATVTAVESTASADRVCVDTGAMLADDEGMLVGSLARGLFFVHAETADSPYVAARPFRVNAGAVHAYVRVPEGRTRYLSELASGDSVLVVDRDGATREALVGRAKIERRPVFRLEAETADGDRIETLLQNAETVALATPAGRTAVTELSAGDEVLCYHEATARHFGEAVEESIIEK